MNSPPLWSRSSSLGVLAIHFLRLSTRNRRSLACKRSPGGHCCSNRNSGAVGAAPGVARASATRGVGVDRGQDTEQGRPASGPRRLPTPTDAGHGARPLEARMQRCRLLGIRRTHRTEAPRKDLGPARNQADPTQLSGCPRLASTVAVGSNLGSPVCVHRVSDNPNRDRSIFSLISRRWLARSGLRM